MKHFKALLAVIFLVCPYLAYSNKQYIPFDYYRDINAVQNLIKKEWQKLFLSPFYDDALIHKMFFKRKPGDVSVVNTTAHIDVLYSEGKLAGFVTYYYKDPNIGHLELLAIDSQFRKKGYGKYIIEQVTQECKKHECTTLQLYVYTSNPSAIKFYEHLGFTLKANFGSYILLYKHI
jgi:ribosomal protein S18 acetylase RimI-like enzyme